MNFTLMTFNHLHSLYAFTQVEVEYKCYNDKWNIEHELKDTRPLSLSECVSCCSFLSLASTSPPA